MEKSRLVGVVICLGTALVGVAFIWGIALRNYWAAAIPVMIEHGIKFRDRFLGKRLRIIYPSQKYVGLGLKAFRYVHLEQ